MNVGLLGEYQGGMSSSSSSGDVEFLGHLHWEDMVEYETSGNTVQDHMTFKSSRQVSV